MYPISGGYETAIARINKLQSGEHFAEALLAAVFTFEKSCTRGLRYLALARGFTSNHARTLFDRNGFEKTRIVWPCFDRDGRTLPQFVGSNWEHASTANKMRNKLVHGQRVYELKLCKSQTTLVLQAINDFREKFAEETMVDVWETLPRRVKSKTVWDIDWHKQQKTKST